MIARDRTRKLSGFFWTASAKHYSPFFPDLPFLWVKLLAVLPCQTAQKNVQDSYSVLYQEQTARHDESFLETEGIIVQRSYAPKFEKWCQCFCTDIIIGS